MMQRRGSATELAADVALEAKLAAAARRAGTFVPPHMLHRQDSDLAGGVGNTRGGMGAEHSLGLSPSGGAKREKLLARNAILRSTGFLEMHHGTGPMAVIGAWAAAAAGSGSCGQRLLWATAVRWAALAATRVCFHGAAGLGLPPGQCPPSPVQAAGSSSTSLTS